MSSQRNSKRFSDEIWQAVKDLKAEDELQKKITSRILGAAAQISNNHERLVNEIAEVSRDDLDRIEAFKSVPTYSAEQLKLEFKTFNQAKNCFGVTAKGWESLAEKLNFEASNSTASRDGRQVQEVLQRLDRIEQRLDQLQADIQLILRVASKPVS